MGENDGFSSRFMKRRNIIISLRNFGSQDLGTGWEVKAVVENPDVFDGLYFRYPLTELSSLDDYFLYLLSLKLVGLREVIPVLLQDAHKVISLSFPMMPKKHSQLLEMETL